MADISKIKIPNDNTIYDVYDTAAVTSLKTVNNTSLEGSGTISVTESRKVWYGTCSTAASTQDKTVTLSSGMPNFIFTSGNILAVTFTNSNTASNPRIVFGSTYYYIYTLGTYPPSYIWGANETIYLVYYNSSFIITDGPSAVRNSNIYGLGSTKLLDSYNSTDLTTMPTANAARLLNTIISRKADKQSVYTQTLTPASGFQLYTSTVPITLRAWRGFVCVTGTVKPKSAITGSTTEYTICTIPEGYRPDRELVGVMQGSNHSLWTCRVKQDTGAVTFARCRSADAWQDAGTAFWLPFHMMWTTL